MEPCLFDFFCFVFVVKLKNEIGFGVKTHLKLTFRTGLIVNIYCTSESDQLRKVDRKGYMKRMLEESKSLKQKWYFRAMLKKNIVRLIYTSICLLYGILAHADNSVKFEHLNLPPGINSRVDCILEDSKGVMWFGTHNGLVNFDAYEIRPVENITEEGRRGRFGVITALAEDKVNQIWIGTRSGVFIYNKSKQTSKRINDTYLSKAICRTLYVTADNEILIGTENGLYIYNHEGRLLESYLHQPEINTGLSHHVVRSFYEDKQKRIWIGTYDGLNCLDRKKKHFTHYRLQKSDSLNKHNNLILSIQPKNENGDSILLVGTETGLCFFDTNNKTFKQYRHDDDRNSVTNNVIKTICVDGSRIWLGTDLGLNLFSFKENRFQNFHHNHENTYSISNNVINHIYIDSQNNLWLATDNGIDKMYLKGNQVNQNRFYDSSKALEGEFVVTDLSEQANGDVWLTTNQGLIRYDLAKDYYQHYLPPRILHNKTRSVFCDDKGKVWITSAGGLNTYSNNTKQFNSYVANERGRLTLKNNYLNCAAQGASGTIWLGSHNKGVYKVIKGQGDELQFANFHHEPDNDNSLSSDEISDIIIDDKENVWIATNHGLNKIDVLRGVVERYSIGDNNGNEYMSQLFIDKDQTLWLTSSQGIFTTNLDDVNFKRIENINYVVSAMVVRDSVVYFTANNGFYYSDLRSNEVLRIPNADIGLKSVSGVELMTDDKLVIYGKEGFVSLNMNDIKIDKSVPNVYWTNFSILNKSISRFEMHGNRFVINQHINETDNINLKYGENTFSMEFSSLQYSHNKYCTYKYLLEGYDKDWITTKPNKAYAAYTQVRPGTYTLKVKASNKYGLYSDKVREIIITIKPTFYLSFWAMIIYGFVIIGFFIVWRRMLIAREKVNNDVRFQKLQRQKSEELIEIKTRFFTNISHELKTPLTLISSPVDDLLSRELDESIKSSLLLVKRNTDRLKRLVNQILDIRKIETGGEKLSVQEYDIVRFCDRVINQFKEEAERRDLFMQYNTNETSLMMWFDMGKIEKVLVNLISNALKFTPNGGSIRIVVTDGRKLLRKQNELLISVTDDGCGISKKGQAQIFDRFTTLGAANYSNQQGTGIGLSLVKDYVGMHGGNVKVDSEPDKGCCFTFSIPFERNKFGSYEEHIDNEYQSIQNIEADVSISSELVDGNQTGKDVKLKVLVVEDDNDMREYIISGLKDRYQVSEASNGQDGLKMAKKEIPDIIISDWMMPIMNGIDLCEKVKSDLRTCHVPLILLTAKAGMESQMEGIETGADDYIQKPFNMTYLLARIHNLIEQRERLKKVYLQQKSLEPSEITVTSLDEKFLSDVMEQLEKDMDNPELNVKLLSERMGVSHTNLYRKIKALTGQTATEFIRTIRLKRAAQLLKNGQLNVSEVMHMVGFSHRSYFTRSFKELFGVSPKDYN